MCSHVPADWYHIITTVLKLFQRAKHFAASAWGIERWVIVEKNMASKTGRKAGCWYDEDGVVYKISSARKLKDEGAEKDRGLAGKVSTFGGEMTGAI